MGYTNYYNQETDFTDKEWSQIKDEFAYIIEQAGETIVVQYNTDDYIQINGNPGCESFYVSKNARKEKEYDDQDVSFHFCKTRELPYDIYVWHMLVFIKGMKASQGKEDFSISRDR